MTLLGVSLQLHKWIALVIGLQVLFWVAGGVVMTAIPIERVRSEHHLSKVPPAPVDLARTLTAQQAAVRAAIPAPASALLKSTPSGPVWVITPPDGKPKTIDAITGAPVRTLAEGDARRLAARSYVGSGKPVAARYYPAAPKETGREGPMWRVDFDDAERTAFYLAPDTGEVLTRRSNVWRFYDFFWRLHILDFGKGDDFNHPLLIALAALTLPVVLTGFILLWIKLGRDLKTVLDKRRRAALRR